jgi:TPR repeat protein
MNDIGFYYQKGLGGLETDHQMAAYWYQRGAEAGDPASMSNLGYCYRNGIGVKKDLHTGVVWTKKAAEEGNMASAWRTLGWCYQNELGCSLSYAHAFRCYTNASELGNVQALNDLGWFYEKVRAHCGRERECVCVTDRQCVKE